MYPAYESTGYRDVAPMERDQNHLDCFSSALKVSLLIPLRRSR